MKKLFCFTLSLLLSLSSSFALGLPPKEDVPLDKEWTVEFTSAPDMDTVSDNIYVTDPQGLNVDCTVSAGAEPNTVLVSPKSDYAHAETYTLYITDSVKSEAGESLNETTSMDFTTIDAVLSDLKVYFLDVGQGDCTYIKTPYGDDILIDAGNNWYGDDVVGYLNDLNVDDIEVMIATHPDADHIGGLDVVLEHFDVESVYAPKVSHTTQTYFDFLNAVKDEGLTIKESKAGVEIPLSGVDAAFVGPAKEYGSDLNTWSAVLRLAYQDNSFLFAGDATIESEEDMIASGQDLQADVLKLGHHGASTSTSQSFLDAVNPTWGVVSCGQDNSYGHPTDEILNRLATSGIDVFRTDMQGTVLAISNGETVSWDTKPWENIVEAPADISIQSIDKEAEIVAIINNSTNNVDMTGWYLVSVLGNQTYDFPDGFVLEAGVTVYVTAGKNATDNGSTHLKWTGSYVWNNAEPDPGELYDGSGELVSTY